MKLFVVCPRGLETPLHEELSALVQKFLEPTTESNAELRAQLSSTIISPIPVKPTGGIEVSGSHTLVMLINLYSRIASRVLMQLAHTTYRSEDDIYNTVRGLAWEDWFDPTQTLRVDTTSQRSNLTSLNFVNLKIKDGVCDRMREVKGERPDIDRATPDVRVMAFINQTHLSVYLDTSGESLFKRGWRDEKGAAPLKENLAAGILALTGWEPSKPLFDPMCGSGTFLIEAAQIALHIPPGAIRAGLVKQDHANNELDTPFLREDQAPKNLKLNTEETLKVELNKVELNKAELNKVEPMPTIAQESCVINETLADALEEEKPASVWQAPISEVTGQPIVTVRVNQPITSGHRTQNLKTDQQPVSLESKRTRVLDHRDDLPEQRQVRRAQQFKPTRVDLVSEVQGFGFSRLKPFALKKEMQSWETLKQGATQEMKLFSRETLHIAGSDINEKMVAMCQRNWQKAGLPGKPVVKQVDALVSKNPFQTNGILLFNPPYGERIDIKGGRGDDEWETQTFSNDKMQRGARDPLPKNITDPEFVEFLAQFGRHLKNQFPGWQVDVLTADMGLPGQLRMKESKRTPLFNGAIECRLFRFNILEAIRSA